MNDSIVQVDLSKLDSEIEGLKTSISTYTAQLNEKIKFRELIRSMEVGLSKAIAGTSTEVDRSGEMGVSDFIIDFLSKNGSSSSSAVTEHYAKYKKKTKEAVQGNVANALSRLKTLNKLDYLPNSPTNKKAGGKWFVK